MPDILTCAKALAGGIAAGVMIARPSVAAVLKPGMHASTFGGNPIACRAALAAIETIEAEGLLERGAAIGERFRGHFEAIRGKLPDLVRDIRIMGTMIGLDLTIDATNIVAECMRRRLLINATHGHVIRLLPALTITDDQIDAGLRHPGGCIAAGRRLKRISGMPRHFLDLLDISAAEARRLDRSVDRAQARRAGRGGGPRSCRAARLGLLFEKPSLRTRVSFEAAIARLGGNAIFLHGKDVGLGVRESVVDFARVLSQYVDVLAARTFSHATVEELARSATIPVINALSDASHPCQAMADFMTIEELRGSLSGKKLVFVGDGNNVARSLAAASALSRRPLRAGCAPGYEFPADFQARFAAKFPAVALVVECDPRTGGQRRRRRLYRRLGQHGPGA